MTILELLKEKQEEILHLAAKNGVHEYYWYVMC